MLCRDRSTREKLEGLVSGEAALVGGLLHTACVHTGEGDQPLFRALASK